MPHAAFPTITNHGVPAMSAPKIVAITFNNDANASTINSYVTSLGTTTWWKTVLKDYAVGPATAQSVAVSASLEASYSDDPSGMLPDGGTPTMPGFVVSTVTGNANIPPPDASTIYVLHAPPHDVPDFKGRRRVRRWAGYHNSTSAGGAARTCMR